VTFRFDGSAWIVLYPQFLNPRPAVIAELPFRQALLYAIDRQAMVDTLQGGVAPVAHAFMPPGQVEYEEIEAQLPRYTYDPRRATQMIEALGYVRGVDGGWRDQTGQRLDVEIRTGALDQAFNPGTAIADYWQRVGVGATALRSTGRLEQDPEVRTTFPGFRIVNNPTGVAGLRILHSANIARPENGFQINANVSRYANAELDGLIDAYVRTIPVADRVGVMGRILRHVAEQLPVMGMYHNPAPDAFATRLRNVRPTRALGSVPSWNAQEWDLQD
jgi:peptide/nickel transport system substrate-binding protein